MGRTPSPDLSSVGRGHSLPAPYPSRRLGCLNAPSALDLSTLPPLKLKAGYALDFIVRWAGYFTSNKTILSQMSVVSRLVVLLLVC